MPTDPFVPTPFDQRPRQEQNLPPGIHLPPARSWRANRPGDVEPGWPEGTLIGSPGPNVGHALKLVHQIADAMAIAEHEPREAAVTVAADLAMRRAAIIGRAPIPADVQVALAILGYDGSADSDFSVWRGVAVAHAAHDYPTRRELVDGVPADVLRLEPDELAGGVDQARLAIRTAVGG